MSSRLAGFGLSALLLYFAFHALAGEKGLGQWTDMQRELAAKKTELAALEEDVDRLEKDIVRLTPGSVDPDFVEALAREKLGYAYPNEIIIMADTSRSAF